MDVIGAKQRRAELIKKRRELIEGVEARGGKLSATERELMASWESECKRLADLLDEEEAKDQRLAKIALGAGLARKDAYGQLGPGEVRTLAPDQRMSDLPSMELPDGLRASDLSLGRIIRAMVRNDWTGAEAEARAVMVGGTGSLGGVLVPEALSLDVLDLARAQACVVKAGAATVPMESATLTIARQVTDPEGVWRGENVAITESSGSFDWVKLQANALACLVRLSVELVEDASNVVGIIDNAISQALALKLDYAALMGSGVSPEPLLRSGPNVSARCRIDGRERCGYDGRSAGCEKLKPAAQTSAGLRSWHLATLISAGVPTGDIVPRVQGGADSTSVRLHAVLR